MYYVYISKTKDGKALHIDSTRNITKRIQQDSHRMPPTKPTRSLQLIYYEAYKADKDAVKREQDLKAHPSTLAELKARIQKSLQEK